MKKYIINRIDLYKSISKMQSIQNEDFDIDNFLHFPILTNNDGNMWKHGSLFLSGYAGIIRV